MPVYLDCNATTPIEPGVLEAMLECWREGPANAGSRTHAFGTEAKKRTEWARDRVAEIAGVGRDEVVFTSGATESNNLATLGLEEHGRTTGRMHVVSTLIEHKAVLEPLEELGRRGFAVDLVPPGPGGRIDPEAIGAAIRPDTLLVSVMQVNNETGVVQPIEEVSRVLRGHEAFFHVDAAQGFGKESAPLRDPRVDLVSVTAHKLYGPQGIGALLTRRRGYRRIPLRPLMFGGRQERGLRPGTLPVPLVVGFGKACELAAQDHVSRTAACRAFRNRVWSAIGQLHPIQNGVEEHTMPHVLNVSFPGIDSEALMVALRDWVALSNGSACTSHSYTPSHVLQAMGLSDERISGAIRISWSHLTPEPEWERVTEAFRRLRP